MALIKLTDDNKRSFYLNPDHIVSIEPLYQGTLSVRMSNGNVYKVVESELAAFLFTADINYNTPVVLNEDIAIDQHVDKEKSVAAPL